jgi:VanZ family protein
MLAAPDPASRADRLPPTSAWPLALALGCLVVYASLYPFADWRDQGLSPWAFLAAPLPRYWTWFDTWTNLLGYAPLGFLLALGGLRLGLAWPVTRAALLCALLSLMMESVQMYLPARVPSKVDFALNALGGGLGAGLAFSLERWGVLQRWSEFRQRWFLPQARGALVLLALWPAALLFPASVPLGLGQVMERLEAALVILFRGTPFLEWLPVRDVELEPLVPGGVVICVALGALVPGLLGYSVIAQAGRRLLFWLLLLVLAVASTALSSMLSFGPEHAWAWLDQPVRFGLLGALVLGLAALRLPARAAAALGLLAVGLHLALLNQAPADPYFEQTRQVWEQGRFVRFNGLTQWLGWLWPFGVLAYLVLRLSGREARADT